MTRWCWTIVAGLLAFGVTARAVDPPAKTPVKPLKVLLVTGGCCHDYAKQKDILKKGIEARAHVIVDQMHTDDKSTKALFDKYKEKSWAEGYDVVIHDECSADVKDIDYVLNILNEHRRGIPAVNLHCAMHCYRVSPEFKSSTLKPGTQDSMWFDFIGLQSTGHGPQEPIDVKYVTTDHPITKTLKDWTTIKEELYNNIQIFDGTTPLARGKQSIKGKDTETVVAWTNLFGERKTRVFSTTLGHNNDTVGDDRFLNLVVRGLLWSCDKLNDDYLKKYDPAQDKPAPGPQPTPAKQPEKKTEAAPPAKVEAKPVAAPVKKKS